MMDGGTSRVPGASIMESHSHRNLKILAGAFLWNEGFRMIGREVRCPGSRYRVDVAGYLDRLPHPAQRDERGEPTLWSTAPPGSGARRNGACEPRTIIIECKQSRGDFIRDDRSADELIALRDELRRWRAHLEEHRIKPSEPELRRSGAALFAELEDWDFHASRLPSYRRLLQRLRVVERQLYGETKFSLVRRYRLADRCYIAAPRGLLRPREVPDGWGLLECARSGLRAESLTWADATSQHPEIWRITVGPVELQSPPKQRARLLRHIAIAATRDAMRSNEAPAERNPVDAAQARASVSLESPASSSSTSDASADSAAAESSALTSS